MGKCGFCGKKNNDNIPITDSETQREILICEECDKLLFFEIPTKVKDKFEQINNSKDITIQQLDELIDAEIEYLKFKRKGLEP